MAIKRRQSITPANAAKKPRNATKQCGVVGAAVLRSDKYSKATLQMLSSSLPNCLGVPKESRDSMQEQVIKMVNEVLSSVKQSFEARIKDAESKLSSATSDKAAREQACRATSDDCTSKNAALAAAVAAMDASAQKISEAKAKLAEAESAKSEGDKVLADAGKKKARLDAALTDAFNPLKEGTAGKAGKLVSSLTSLGKDFEIDASMLSYLPEVLTKAPADRGSFDAMVLTNFENEANKNVKNLEKAFAEGEVATAERAASVDAAKAALESAKTDAEPCKEAHNAAKVENDAAKAAHKASTSALQMFEPEMKRVEKDLATAKSELQTFLEGAQATFDDLLILSAEKPVAEVAADAEPVAASTA